jgi:hypothetical protein
VGVTDHRDRKRDDSDQVDRAHVESATQAQPKNGTTIAKPPSKEMTGLASSAAEWKAFPGWVWLRAT